MLTRSIIAALASFFATTTIRASDLLFSVDLAPNGQSAPFSAPEGLQFLLRYDSPLFYFGTGVFWQDGAAGTFDFTDANETAFPDLEQRLTNGIDEELYALTFNSDGGGNGGVWLESLWGFGDPDLAGYDLDLIRLTVHELSIEEYNDPEFGDGLIWDGSITWDFYGEPVPEPSSLACLLLGALALRRAKRRAAVYR